MTNTEKRQAALRVLELRGSFGRARYVPPGMPRVPDDPHELNLERMRGVMADLYSEHFSDEQLQAMLDFYESDMWKSIVETEFKFQEHFLERMHEQASKQSSPPRLSAASGVRMFFEREAYLAMCRFLANYYERGHSDNIAALLGNLSLLPSGESADAAMLDDWKEACRAVRAGEVDARMQLRP